MRILFLGDVVGISGCSKLMSNLLNEIKLKKICIKQKDNIIYIFWVNDKNEIIIGTIENNIKNTFYRDLGINEKLAFKEIFEEIEKVNAVYKKYIKKEVHQLW